MLLKYADDEMKKFKERANEGDDQPEDNAVARPRLKFKHVDGIERLADMSLPFLIDLLNTPGANKILRYYGISY